MTRCQEELPDLPKDPPPTEVSRPPLDREKLKKRRRLPAEEEFRREEDEENDKLPFPNPLNG